MRCYVTLQVVDGVRKISIRVPILFGSSFKLNTRKILNTYLAVLVIKMGFVKMKACICSSTKFIGVQKMRMYFFFQLFVYENFIISSCGLSSWGQCTVRINKFIRLIFAEYCYYSVSLFCYVSCVNLCVNKVIYE